MKEHAQFIAHLLDPTEVGLIQTAEEFADLFKELQEQVLRLEKRGIGSVEKLINEEIKATRSIRDFKAEDTDLLLPAKPYMPLGSHLCVALSCIKVKALILSTKINQLHVIFYILNQINYYSSTGRTCA